MYYDSYVAVTRWILLAGFSRIVFSTAPDCRRHPTSTPYTPMSCSTDSRLLRRPEVQTLTGLSKSTMYQMIADGEFPKQIQIGKRSVFWVEGHITQWIEEKIALSR